MSKKKQIIVDKHFKLIENYAQAVSSVRETYFNVAKSQLINSIEQSITIDHILILDFMIESNQQMLNYLQRFKQHDNVLSIQALEALFEKLAVDENEDIHAIIQRLKQIIINDGPAVSNKLRNAYQLIANISLFLLMPICCGLTLSLGVLLGPSLLIAMPIIIIGTIFIGLTAGIHKSFDQPEKKSLAALYKLDTNSKDYKNEKQLLNIRHRFWVENPPSEVDDSTLFSKSYDKDFMIRETRKDSHSTITTTTTLFSPKRESTIKVLREKFIDELSHEVTKKYRSYL